MSAHTVRTYDTMDAFISAATATPKLDCSSHKVGIGRGGFRGTETFQEGHDLALDGWMSERPAVDSLRAVLDGRIRNLIVPRIQYLPGLTGSRVNMGRYAQGHPRCAVKPTFVETRVPTKVVTILVSHGALGNVSGDLKRQRGAAVAALVDLLQASNRSVEVWSESTVSPSGSGRTGLDTVLVKLKGASDPCDVNRLTFAIAHPAMQRRIGWSERESCENEDYRRRFGFGEGSTGMGRSVPLTQATQLGADVTCDTILSSDQWDTESSVRWILQTLRACGVNIDEGNDR